MLEKLFNASHLKVSSPPTEHLMENDLPVQEGGGLPGDVVVDDQGDVGGVDPTGAEVCRHNDPEAHCVAFEFAAGCLFTIAYFLGSFHRKTTI